MGKVISLKSARKRKTKGEKRAFADTNAALHGLSKAEKQSAKRDVARANAQLDAHKRDDGQT